MPDGLLQAIYPHVANPRQLQDAVAALKQDDAMHALQRATSVTPGAQPQAAAYPACPGDTIIDTAPGAACTPSLPRPDQRCMAETGEPVDYVWSVFPVGLQQCEFSILQFDGLL